MGRFQGGRDSKTRVIRWEKSEGERDWKGSAGEGLGKRDLCLKMLYEDLVTLLRYKDILKPFFKYHTAMIP